MKGTFDRIKAEDVVFPESESPVCLFLICARLADAPNAPRFDPPCQVSSEFQDLIRGLLRRDPRARLGGGAGGAGAAAVKAHPFFAGMDWDGMRGQRSLPCIRTHTLVLTPTNARALARA